MQTETRPAPRGARAEWQLDKTFEDKATNIVVRVQVLDLGPFRTKYSVDVGSTRDNHTVRFLTPAARVENAQVTLPMVGMTVARLLDEAYLYVQEKLQAQEDRAIEQRQERELRGLERQAQGPKKIGGLSRFTDGSKTTREQTSGKAARYEHNQAARRGADAELRSKMRGK
jgi:hypothetical protein